MQVYLYLFALFWIYIAWRAMKAHEQIAVEAKRFNDSQIHDKLRDSKDELVEHKKLYKQFNRENPDVDQLTSKERHDQFRAWLLER